MAIAQQRRRIKLHLPLPERPERRYRDQWSVPLSHFVSSAITSGKSFVGDKFEKLQVLGRGNGGTVYQVRVKETASKSQTYALKVVHDGEDPIVRRQICREIEILRRTDSPYIVKCHEVYEKSCGEIGMLLEHMELGTLETLLIKKGTFKEQDLAHVARQVLNGLCYLHTHKIIHRDIKPSNLLVNAKMEIKIADFGVGKIMSRSLDASNSYVGTCAYMSPERFDPDAYGGNYNGYAGDVWSLGITLMELYLGYFPLLMKGQRPDWATLMWAICFGDPPCLPDSASEKFRGFIECCLQKEFGKRWTAAQLLNHPFVQ